MSTGKHFTKRTIFFLALAALGLIGLVWDGSPLGSLVLRQAVKAKFSSVRSVTPGETGGVAVGSKPAASASG